MNNDRRLRSKPEPCLEPLVAAIDDADQRRDLILRVVTVCKPLPQIEGKKMSISATMLAVERLILLTDIRKARAKHKPTADLQRRLERATARLLEMGARI